MENLAYLEKKTAKNIMKMDTKDYAWHSWFHVIFLATSCFFPGFKYSGKFGFLACSGDQEPLIIYALSYPSFPL